MFKVLNKYLDYLEMRHKEHMKQYQPLSKPPVWQSTTVTRPAMVASTYVQRLQSLGVAIDNADLIEEGFEKIIRYISDMMIVQEDLMVEIKSLKGFSTCASCDIRFGFNGDYLCDACRTPQFDDPTAAF